MFARLASCCFRTGTQDLHWCPFFITWAVKYRYKESAEVFVLSSWCSALMLLTYSSRQTECKTSQASSQRLAAGCWTCQVFYGYGLWCKQQGRWVVCTFHLLSTTWYAYEKAVVHNRTIDWQTDIFRSSGLLVRGTCISGYGAMSAVSRQLASTAVLVLYVKDLGGA